MKEKHSVNTQIKKDLLSVSHEGRLCCLKSELHTLMGLLLKNHTSSLVKLRTNDVLCARRIVFLARKVYGKSQQIKLTSTNNKRSKGKHLIDLEIQNPEFALPDSDFGHFDVFRAPKCCIKAWVTGIAWHGAYLSIPQKGLRLEVVFPSFVNKSQVEHAFSQIGAEMFYTHRRQRLVCLMTSSEKIEGFLTILGAMTTVLLLQDVLITRDIKNSVNRSVNCEVGNLRRSTNSSAKDLEAIKFLKERTIFDKLPVKLQAVGEARVDYPDLTITELGEILVPPLTKAGVFHRLKKLREAAENERKRQQ